MTAAVSSGMVLGWRRFVVGCSPQADFRSKLHPSPSPSALHSLIPSCYYRLSGPSTPYDVTYLAAIHQLKPSIGYPCGLKTISSYGFTAKMWGFTTLGSCYRVTVRRCCRWQAEANLSAEVACEQTTVIEWRHSNVHMNNLAYPQKSPFPFCIWLSSWNSLRGS